MGWWFGWGGDGGRIPGTSSAEDSLNSLSQFDAKNTAILSSTT